ncbi:sensor histidine kinase [Niallia sp. Sow4_A1]|jgi:two-component system, NarL family, sensor histidine kinase DesK|uniref:sensor histidine kinase n=1 Tax=Bacillaceae TaxID=186817 RepID=UPI0004E11436|nr:MULTISPECIES: sensor histidine kinase [Bacillaceae]MCF2650746.1 sensor histidine kinase [Niallia circulans]MCM3362404.1 sensor histidine kinase [Niallia sp. MER TA 168]CAI9392505.1 Sensor histidine kinase DesK [Bacillus sp. T2.9-1]
MIKRLEVLKKSTGISPYIWTLLTILPFYFIFHASSAVDVISGIILTILFFLFYRIAYLSKGWTIYLWPSLLIGISTFAIYTYSYVYFSFFLSYFIGNIKKRIPFFILYFIHLAVTTFAIYFKIILGDPLLIKQLPFVLIIWFGVILLPLNIQNRKEKDQLQEQLEDANKRISHLVKLEERQRIARDLHDTLGQKLSLIGLKSDLARKLVYKDPEQARLELKDIQHTSRSALNEVRKMVSEMRGIKLKDELLLVKKIVEAAEINLTCDIASNLRISSIAENIISMCLKEAVTNVVRHSHATACSISIHQNNKETIMEIKDNGTTPFKEEDAHNGNGLAGMRERLDFINGTIEITSKAGTIVTIAVPRDGKIIEREELL